jgi:hypothetical protein
MGGMWWNHLQNLWLRSWFKVTHALGTTTLAVVLWSVAVPALIWTVKLTLKWRQLRRRQDVSPLKTAFRDSALSAIVTVGVTLAVWGIIISVSIVHTVFEDHQALVAKNQELTKENARLRSVSASVCKPQEEELAHL